MTDCRQFIFRILCTKMRCLLRKEDEELLQLFVLFLLVGDVFLISKNYPLGYAPKRCAFSCVRMDCVL